MSYMERRLGLDYLLTMILLESGDMVLVMGQRDEADDRENVEPVWSRSLAKDGVACHWFRTSLSRLKHRVLALMFLFSNNQTIYCWFYIDLCSQPMTYLHEMLAYPDFLI